MSVKRGLVPNFEGTYIVEASLVQAQLTAYDSKYIQIFEVPTHVESSENSFVVSKNLVSGSLVLFALI
jgi:hypothetical protein